jgi:hypothetical protein
MFGKGKQKVNNPMVMQPNFQQDEMEINQENPIYNPSYPPQSQPIQQQQVQQPMQPIQQPQGIVQQMQQAQPVNQQKAIIFKVEYTDKGTIKFEGEANYLINLGDCQVNQ